MARRATGAVVEHRGKDGRIYRAIRFTAYGKRRFVSLGPVGRADAQQELGYALADVERGTWQPAQPAEPPPEVIVPTLHEFAETWWVEREREWRDSTRADYRWRLECHLLPYFKDIALTDINIATVDAYKAAKLREERLGGESINKTLALLSAILEAAEERELISRNPARGRRRRVRSTKPNRSYLDTAEQIEALLDAAGELDQQARPDRRHVLRRMMLATLTFAGLRIGELLDLRWREVDLATGRLRVGEAKTEAGRRYVMLRPALLVELKALKADTAPSSDDYVFPTSTGRRQTAENVRNRVLAKAVNGANEHLAERGAPPLPERLTPHSLRRTFASLLYAIGETPPTVMAEMGHTTPGQ